MNKIILVNKSTCIGDYVPNNLVNVDSIYKKGIMLDKEAYENWLALKDKALSMGYIIEVESGYRSYKRQKELWDELVNEKGLEYTKQALAEPGHSEHQTGLAIDYCIYENNICIIEHQMKNHKACYYTNSIAHEYGFIIRYPEGKEDVTGYMYEPWHLRYVGKTLATYLHKKNLTLDEYLCNKN